MQKRITRRNLYAKLGRVVETDMYEDIIAEDVIHPDSIEIGMEDIGGLEETKTVLVSSTKTA